MGSGTNFINGTGALNGSSVYGGADKDTFLFTANSLNSARVGSQGGNDSLSFSTAATSGAIVVNTGAGADTVYFGNTVSATSILGGSGNDLVEFAGGASSAARHGAILGTDNKYYYESGTDTIQFTTQQTNTTLDALTFYTKTGAPTLLLDC